jgi:hypothetical protein
VRWAEAGVVLGLLLLALGFGVGIEPVSVSAAGQSYDCGSSIPTSWFAGGSPTVVVPARSYAVKARCGSALRGDRWLTWGLIGSGSLVALAGWTALREAADGRPGSGRVRGEQGPAAGAVHA